MTQGDPKVLQNRPKEYWRLAVSKSSSPQADVEPEVDVRVFLDKLGRRLMILGPVVSFEPDGQVELRSR